MSQKTKDLCMGCMKPLDNDNTPCPHCNWEPDAVWDLQYLKPGTVLSARYIVGVYARKNGEGAMYIGYDNSLQSKVWIHEYFPVTLAQREVETGRISPLPGCGAQYKALMSDFVDVCNEVKRLGITEPVVPIENVLSENNTVYAIYKGLETVSLEEHLQKIGAPLPHASAAELLVPICNTLGTVHTHGHIHRGVSPYSIYVDRDGKAWLWDFALGATRTAGSELDSELFTGYSAPEQYSPSGWQGSWTDVYAMGALFYRVLTGIVPPKSIRLNKEQPLSPVGELVIGLPRNVSETISDAMLASTEDRIQAMPTFVSGLLETRPGATAVYDTSKVARAGAAAGNARGAQADDEEPAPRRRRRRGSSAKYVVLGMFCTVLVLGGLIWYFMNSIYPNIMPTPAEDENSSQAEDSGVVGADDVADDEVPLFIGRMLTTVESNNAYDDRFVFDVQEDYNNEFAEGEIYDQYPSAGTRMPERGTVVLYVSKGAKKELMPQLEGYALDQAIDILKNLGVTDTGYEIIDQYSATADPGTVLRTYPEAGAEFDPTRQGILIFVMKEISVVEGSQSSQPEPSQPEQPQSQPEESVESYPPIIFPSGNF